LATLGFATEKKVFSRMKAVFYKLVIHC